MRQFSAIAASTANSTACRFSTGSAPGKSEAYRADVGVWRIAELCGASAEDFRLGQQLDVDLKPDDRLVLGARRDRRFRRGGHDG